MSLVDYFAKILRAEPAQLDKVVRLLEARSGRNEVLQSLQAENETKMSAAMERMGIEPNITLSDFFAVIGRWVKGSEATLLTALYATHDPQSPEGDFGHLSEVLCNSAFAISGNQRGFFLKVGRARELLEKYPPPNILSHFGYKTTAELLTRENLFEVWAALRFAESREWMNGTFLKAYEGLTADDFEERVVRLFVLPKKWLDVAEKYVQKKFHNVSHLKEMGVIFVEPINDNAPGVYLRIFLLLLHYLHEVPFYSQLFRRAQGPQFARKIISYLRGDVRELSDVEAENQVLIIQRYLAKEDASDRRLFLPHVNPEAIHWHKAEGDFNAFAERSGGSTLAIWKDLDWVGGFLGENPVAFNLIDAVMSVIGGEHSPQEEKVEMKYRYHHQEALWNKIFFAHLGEKVVEEMILANLERGYLEL
ncbi:MAG: hypothetical protein U1A16_01085 [Patescibacteria group bacterium]|nr:hypothetical protein [Patescibacteria group bacterium]